MNSEGELPNGCEQKRHVASRGRAAWSVRMPGGGPKKGGFKAANKKGGSSLKKKGPAKDGIKKSRAALLKKTAALPVALPQATYVETKKMIGRAIVLAHGVGGSSSHSSMKAWRERLQEVSTCDEVIMVDFPRPHCTSTLGATMLEGLQRAHAAGHRRVCLAGVGMGARAALQLLSGVAGDDGEAAPALPAELRACVVSVLALAYPIAKPGAPTELRIDELLDMARAFRARPHTRRVPKLGCDVREQRELPDRRVELPHEHLHELLVRRAHVVTKQ